MSSETSSSLKLDLLCVSLQKTIVSGIDAASELNLTFFHDVISELNLTSFHTEHWFQKETSKFFFQISQSLHLNAIFQISFFSVPAWCSSKSKLNVVRSNGNFFRYKYKIYRMDISSVVPCFLFYFYFCYH